MNKDLKRLVRLLLVALLCASCNQGVVRTLVEPKIIQAASAEQPKNIILFIGDGMGFESVRSASLYKSGRESSLCFQSFPHQAGLTHNNASGGTTDSAAAATAIATGVKVHNSVLSLALPGDGREVTTLLEVYQGKGKQVGLVTTSHIEDATPAAFAAHQPTRRLHRQIATDLLETRPHLLMGAYLAVTPEVAAGKGYQVVESSEEMEAVGADLRTPLAGLFRYGKLP